MPPACGVTVTVARGRRGGWRRCRSGRLVVHSGQMPDFIVERFEKLDD
jgi:hypothetical protein